MLEGPFAEQNSREVELKEFVEPALMGQVLHFLYFRNGELLTCSMRNYGHCCPSGISLDEIPNTNSSISLHCHKFKSIGSLNIILDFSPFHCFIFDVAVL